MKNFRIGSVLDSKINKWISEQLGIICSEILSSLKDNVESIILSGGFARGEGTIKMKGNKILPCNDFDIYVISKREISHEESDKIAIKASRKIGYEGISTLHNFKKENQKIEKNFYVDMSILTKEQLKTLLPRLKWYELKYSSLVLYGKDYRSLIPDYKLKDIPLSEGIKILLDRMSQISYYYSSEGKYEKENLSYFIQQAYAACLTTLLLISKKYKIGYYKNMLTFMKTYKKDFPKLAKVLPNLDRKIKQFIEWRIKQEKTPKDIENIEKEWFECRDNIFEVTKYALSFFLKRNIKDVNEMSNAIVKMASTYYYPYLKRKFGIFTKATIPVLNLYFKLKYFKSMKKKKIRVFLNLNSPDMIIFATVPYLIFGIERNKNGKTIENKGMMKKAKEMVNKIYASKARNWEELSLEYADAYFTFYLQKFA